MQDGLQVRVGILCFNAKNNTVCAVECRVWKRSILMCLLHCFDFVTAVYICATLSGIIGSLRSITCGDQL